MAKRITRIDAKRARGELIRVILYDRVSGDRQEDEGTSLETQLEDNTAYANENGYVIVDVVEETHSGYELEQREKFMKALKMCKDGFADGLVFRTYDRLTRNKTHFTVLMYEAERCGYGLFCVKEQFDASNMFESMLRDMVAWFAEFERAKIKERTAGGKVKRAQAGRLINGKKPRYGYAYENTYLEQDRVIIHTHYRRVEYEAGIVNKIDGLYIMGYGQQRIADMLTEEKIPTPSGGTIWGRTTVGLILTCTEYHQEGYAYGSTLVISETGKRKHVALPIEERIKLPESVYPLIRTYETYLAIQARLHEAHSTAITYHVPKEMLLKGGHIFCAKCGRRMNPHLERNSSNRLDYTYPIYRCRAYANGNHSHDTLHNVQIVASTVEKKVIEFVKLLLKDLSRIERALEAHIAQHAAQGSLDSYDNAIAKVQERQREIAEDMKELRGNGRQLLLGQINALEDEIEKLTKYRSQVMGDGNRWEVITREVNEVLEWLRESNADIETASYEEKRKLLRVLGIYVKVWKAEKREGEASRSTSEVYASLNLPPLDSTSLSIVLQADDPIHLDVSLLQTQTFYQTMT